MAIIGSGWYGTQCAIHLTQVGYSVTVFEQNLEAFGGVSGTFGVRLHIGPHYPRSQETRDNCRGGREEFKQTYAELVNEHSHSIYGVGKVDADGKSSKVTVDQFKAVCRELPTPQLTEIDAVASGFSGTELESAFDIPEESSLVLGERLRSYFVTCFNDQKIDIKYNHVVTQIIPRDKGYELVTTTANHLMTIQSVFWFDRVVNATSFKAHVPHTLPNPLRVVYQVCLALVYEAAIPTQKPRSFIVMDGSFPCVMPYDVRKDTTTSINYYILTHAKYTNIMTADNLNDAELFLKNDVPALIPDVKQYSEKDILRFWPAFSSDFKYLGYRGVVLAKPAAETEFRSAITFEADGVIHIVPGKVSDIFQVAREAEILLSNDPDRLVVDKSFCYVKNGVFDKGRRELLLPLSGDRNTSNLQTHTELRATPVNVANNTKITDVGLFSPNRGQNPQTSSFTLENK